MWRTDFLFQFGFNLVLKNSVLVRKEFGSVWFAKMWFSSDIIVI